MNPTTPMAFVAEPGKIDFREHHPPEMGEDSVRIRVKAVTLCGSDLHIFKGKHPAAPLPVPVGHEIAGEVDQVGPGVSKVKPGDRVAVEPVINCGKCFFCQRGQYHLCTQISFQYRKGQGGLTPFFVAPENWVHKIPGHISFTEGALFEPLAVAIHAVQKSGIGLADTSAIFGAGAIGLLILQLARLSGAGDVLVVDVQDFRLDMAVELGATAGLNNLKMDVLQEIHARTGGLGVDRAFEAVGLNVTLVQSLKALRKGGAAVLVGIFEKEEISLPANLFIQKEISLLGSQGYCWDFQTAVDLVSRGSLDLRRLVTHTFPLSQTQQAFDLLMAQDSGAIKVVIDMET